MRINDPVKRLLDHASANDLEMIVPGPAGQARDQFALEQRRLAQVFAGHGFLSEKRRPGEQNA